MARHWRLTHHRSITMKHLLLIAATLFALTACGDGRPAYVQAPLETAPATYAAPAPATNHDMLLGGLGGAAVGYMLANATHKAAAPAPVSQTVIHQTVVQQTVNKPVLTQPAAIVPKPAAVQAPSMMASYRASSTSVTAAPSWRTSSATSTASAMRSYTPSTSFSARR